MQATFCCGTCPKSGSVRVGKFSRDFFSLEAEGGGEPHIVGLDHFYLEWFDLTDRDRLSL